MHQITSTLSLFAPTLKLFAPMLSLFTSMLSLFAPTLSLFAPTLSLFAPTLSLFAPTLSLFAPMLSLFTPTLSIFTPTLSIFVSSHYFLLRVGFPTEMTKKQKYGSLVGCLHFCLCHFRRKSQIMCALLLFLSFPTGISLKPRYIPWYFFKNNTVLGQKIFGKQTIVCIDDVLLRFDAHGG